MKNKLQGVTEAFEANVERVLSLAEFDHMVLDVAIRTLKGIQERAKTDGITSYLLTVDHGLKQITNIRANDSLRPQYQHMFNQCVVLLVSYFGSAIQDVFSAAVAERAKTYLTGHLLKEELKLTVKELLDIGDDPHGQLAPLLMRKGDISFQDMQSTARAFDRYCDHKPAKDKDVDNIILGQACRHVIVHSAAIIDRRCVGQLKMAESRTLKPDLRENEKVQFTVEEITTLGDSMMAYISKLTVGLTNVPPQLEELL